MEVVVAGAVVRLNAADLDELQTQLPSRGETQALGLHLPAPAPFDQRSPESQKWGGVLDHHRGRRQSSSEHDIVGPHSLLPLLRASANHTCIGHPSASEKPLHERTLTGLRLDQAKLHAWEPNRQRQSRKASASA